MKRYNIVRPKKYTARDGIEKTIWLQVGTITQFDDGGLGLELNHTSEKLMVFEQKPKENNHENQSSKEPEIRAEDIPY